MIRRGKTEGWLSAPTDRTEEWARFNGAVFNGVRVGTMKGLEDQGSTIISTRDYGPNAEKPLMVVPRDFVLSLELVESYAKGDEVLRKLLAALGDFGRSTRGAILTFLLLQASMSCPTIDGKMGLPNPFTEYVKFLPLELLPTFWSEEERELLTGTTLRPALEAKMKSLSREYERLQEATLEIEPFKSCWWDDVDGQVSFDDWKQVDAMYRSRALEFPNIGDAMVPCIDMANHASGDLTMGLYDTNRNGDAILRLWERKTVKEGDEVTITYGDEKGACEMVFSYGFIEDSMTSARGLFLDLSIPGDDPLGRAKMMINESAPGFHLYEEKKSDELKTAWRSDFVWLVCVNEEDGLSFDLAETVDGGNVLRGLWKGRELEDVASLEVKLHAEPLWNVFRLRAVTLIQQRVGDQLRELYDRQEAVSQVDKGPDSEIRGRPWQLAMRLRQLELATLEQAYGDLEDEKTALVGSDVVVKYLGGSAAEDAADDDFS